MPFIEGSVTASTAAAVMAASIAFPPSCIALSPAPDARAWEVAIIPCRARGAERVPRRFPAGRSPGAMVWAEERVTTERTAVKTGNEKRMKASGKTVTTSWGGEALEAGTRRP